MDLYQDNKRYKKLLKKFQFPFQIYIDSHSLQPHSVAIETLPICFKLKLDQLNDLFFEVFHSRDMIYISTSQYKCIDINALPCQLLSALCIILMLISKIAN